MSTTWTEVFPPFRACSRLCHACAPCPAPLCSGGWLPMNPGGSTSRGFTLWHLWLLLPHRQRYARPAQRGFAKALLRGVLGLFQGRSEPCVGMQGTVQPHCPPRLSFPGGCLFTQWARSSPGSAHAVTGRGELGGEQIDLDKFRSPPSYQIFPSILRILCAMLCTSNTGCREGFLCAACSVNAQHRDETQGLGQKMEIEKWKSRK